MISICMFKGSSLEMIFFLWSMNFYQYFLYFLRGFRNFLKIFSLLNGTWKRDFAINWAPHGRLLGIKILTLSYSNVYLATPLLMSPILCY